MQPCDALRMVDVRRNRRDGDRGGVTGQQRLRRADFRQFRKQRFFDVEAFGGGLNNQICRCQRIDIRHRNQSGEDLSARVRRKLSARYPGREALTNAVNRAGNGVGRNVVNQNLMTVACRHFGNACAHRAAANHGDSPYVQHLISP